LTFITGLVADDKSSFGVLQTLDKFSRNFDSRAAMDPA
jgi:hypothetical protein